jgi:glycosyltransferase involved in cell wall biosynthesis
VSGQEALRILVGHNRYQIRSGEDECADTEMALLRAQGHEVIEYIEQNQRISQLSSLRLACRTVWSQESYHRLRELIHERRPHIAYFQNLFPLISPAAYYITKAEGIPTVQMLQNYRLLCPNALLFRDGHLCEACLDRFVPWPGVVHSCYRGSRAASGAVAVMLTVHRWLRTWDTKVDVYIALTEFARQKFVQGGLPSQKIVVRPNFVHPDPGPGSGPRQYTLFVGRLFPEKGLETLLAAWKRLGEQIPLKIVGEGPLHNHAMTEYGALSNIEWLGRRPLEEIYTLMGSASFLVFPSTWYEGLPRTIIEAFAKGTPVVASDLGAMSTLVEHRRTGLLFTPADPQDLAATIEWAWTHPQAMAEMGRWARQEYEARYTAEQSYERLIAIFRQATHPDVAPPPESGHVTAD